MSDVALAAATPSIAPPGPIQDQTANAALNNPNVYRVLYQEAGTDPVGVPAVASELWNRKQEYGQDYGALITAHQQYGPGYPPGTHEHDSWLQAAKIPDDDPRLARVAALADPYLTGQTPPIHPYLQHYSPGAAHAVGEPVPSFATGPNANYAGNVFFTPANYLVAPDGANTNLPSVEQFYRETGITPPGQQGPAAAQGPAAPQAAPTDQPAQDTSLPTVEQFYQETGLRPPGDQGQQTAPGAPATGGGGIRTQRIAANPATAAMAQLPGVQFAQQHPLAETAISQALFGLGPEIAGAGAWTGTQLQRGMHALGMGANPQFSPGQAFTSSRDLEQQAIDAEAKANPWGSAAANLGGFALGGPGDIASLGGHALEELLARGAPRLAAKAVPRAGARALALGAAGTLSRAGLGLSEGENLSDLANNSLISGAVTAALGLGGEGGGALLAKYAPAVPKLLRPAITTALGVTGGATAGAGAGAVSGSIGAGLHGQDIASGAERGAAGGFKTGAEVGTAMGLGAAFRGGRLATVIPSTAERAAALDAVAAGDHLGTANAIETESPHVTTAETLGDQGVNLAKEAGKGGAYAVEPIHAAVRARSTDTAINERLGNAVQSATGIHPEQAQASVADQIEANKRGPAAAAWKGVDQDAPIYNDQLANLSKQGLVRDKLNFAAHNIGTDAKVLAEPPTVTRTPTGQPIISSAQYQDWLRSGNPDIEAHLNSTPEAVPTARTWIDAQKALSASVARDPATGRTLDDGESTPGNQWRAFWSNSLNAAIKDAIPGLTEAKAASGEHLSLGQAYRSGTKLSTNGPNAESSHGFNTRYPNLTPSEQSGTQNGYLADLYRKMEKPSTNGFNPASYQTPFHQSVQRTMFSENGAAGIQNALQREANLANSGEAITKAAKPIPAPEPDQHGAANVLLGAVGGGAAHGEGLAGIAKGVLGGLTIKNAAQGLSANMANRSFGYRRALGEILAQSPQDTAAQLRARYAQKQVMPLSQSSLGKAIMGNALRGVALTGAHTLQGAQ